MFTEVHFLPFKNNMRKLINDIRDGYYYTLLKFRSQPEAYEQVHSIFKYLFLGYYIAILMLILGFYFKKHPIFIKENIVLDFLIGALFVYIYKVCIDFLLADILKSEINMNQEKSISNANILKFLASMSLSFIVMALAGYILSIA
jgi:hypothetical protein